MYNDVLEQITEDYLKQLGYFTLHNVPYKLSSGGVASDIDVIAIHPTKTDISKVIVVSCKSFQHGIHLKETLSLTNTPDKKVRGSNTRKRYKELVDKEWSESLRKEVERLTGQKEFIFYLSATKYIYKELENDFLNHKLFKENLKGCEIRLISLEEMVLRIQEQVTKTTTPAKSTVGRLIQLICASDGMIAYNPKK